MSDITMCAGKDAARECPRRASCYRCTAKPSLLMQSWFARIPLDADGGCSHFTEAQTRRPCVPLLCSGDRHDVDCPNGAKP